MGVIGLVFLSGFLVIVTTSIISVNDKQTLLFHGQSITILLVVSLVGFGGLLGGLVHSLETIETHQLMLNGKLADTGAIGHMFIGFCGAYVALAVVMIIFGMDIGVVFGANAQISLVIKYVLYLLAIGIVGGYSGLPIISLISNAALKKVQQQVDELKKSEVQTKLDVGAINEDSNELKHKVDALTKSENKLKIEIKEMELKNVLLTAESHARNEEFTRAIDLLKTKFLPFKEKDALAYHWLALCEKRRGQLKEAVEYVKIAINLSPSRLGYFNLACYLQLSGEDDLKVIETLKLAWKYAETLWDKKKLLNGLKGDKDLDSLRNRDLLAFVDLINEIESQMKV